MLTSLPVDGGARLPGSFRVDPGEPQFSALTDGDPLAWQEEGPPQGRFAELGELVRGGVLSMTSLLGSLCPPGAWVSGLSTAVCSEWNPSPAGLLAGRVTRVTHRHGLGPQSSRAHP